MNKIYNFFNIDIGSHDTLVQRRATLVSSILLFTIPIFILITLFHIFYLHNYRLAIFDIIAILFSLYCIYFLKKSSDNITRASKNATVMLMVFIIFYIYSNGNNQISLLWTIFLPIFAILVNGRKIGLYFSAVYYIIIFSMAFNAIGVWEDGMWHLEGFFRFFFASILLTFIMYMNEFALETAYEKLLDTRKREEKHIKDLHKLSITDPLTQLYNRRYFTEMAPKLLSIAKRKKLSLTFFILDIDDFKLYNDSYGHIKGDEALKEISKVLKRHIQRGDDFVFRLGGEEFGGIILSENTDETQKWIDAICSLIKDLKIEHDLSTTSKYMTVSIGVSNTCKDKDISVDKLYALADKALYSAKKDGKNKSVLNSECS